MDWLSALLKIISKLLTLVTPSILKKIKKSGELEKSYEEYLDKAGQGAEQAAEISDDMDAQLKELKDHQNKGPKIT